MLLSLVRKELREIAGIAALAAAAYAVVVSAFVGLTLFTWLPWIGDAARSVPFLNDFDQIFCLIGLGLAIALGLRQSAWEHTRNTYLFLLHRPASRRQIFLTKIATGILVLLTVTAAPILVYALWAATPGTHASPFYWSMTLESWRFWAGLPLVYLGALLSGLRRARWFGTRLLPLLGALVLFAAVSASPTTMLVSLIVATLGAGISLAAIFYVAYEADYS